MSDQVINITVVKVAKEAVNIAVNKTVREVVLTASLVNEPLFTSSAAHGITSADIATWNSDIGGTGERITGIDGGVLNSLSIGNDYLYVCVQGGEAGVAIWKKMVLFQSV